MTREMIQYFNIQDMESGVIVYSVIPDSPASKAGLLRGDVLMEIDGTKITDTAHIQGLITSHRVGDIVCVKVNRDGNVLEVNVVLEPSQIQN
jgi:serine protease Do